MHTARGNDALFAKIRSLTLALLDVSTWNDLNEVLATNVLVEFDADYVCCHVQSDHCGLRSYPLRMATRPPFEPFVSGQMPVCAALRAAELQSLFPARTSTTATAAPCCFR